MEHVFATLDVLATNRNRLDEVLAVLAEAQIKTQEQFLKTDRRFEDTDRRIADLVSGIGELIREMRQSRN